MVEVWYEPEFWLRHVDQFAAVREAPRGLNDGNPASVEDEWLLSIAAFADAVSCNGDAMIVAVRAMEADGAAMGHMTGGGSEEYKIALARFLTTSGIPKKTVDRAPTLRTRDIAELLARIARSLVVEWEQRDLFFRTNDSQANAKADWRFEDNMRLTKRLNDLISRVRGRARTQRTETPGKRIDTGRKPIPGRRAQ